MSKHSLPLRAGLRRAPKSFPKNVRNTSKTTSRTLQVSPQIKASVINRWGRQCVYCGQDYGALDHIVPYVHGGENVVANLVPTCTRCNSLLGKSKFNNLYEKVVWVRMQIGDNTPVPDEFRTYTGQKGSDSGQYRHRHSRKILLGIDKPPESEHYLPFGWADANRPTWHARVYGGSKK